MSLRVVAALLWGSGFCALFYQTAWQRLLGAAHPGYRAHAALELFEAPFAAYVGDDPRRGVAEKLAASSGDAALCVKAMGPHVAEPTWEEAFLVQRLQCLAAAGRPEAERAAKDLLEFQASTAGTFDPEPGH